MKSGFRLLAALALFWWLLACLQGCGGLPFSYPRPVSTALSLPEKTSLGRASKALEAALPGMSGCHLLATGSEAFTARVFLTDRAEKTLDLQYYIFETDLTGKFLLDRLLNAAERGVRVRLLLDDWRLAREMDWSLALVETNPNIEVRVFNPLGGLRSSLPSRVLGVLLGPERLKGRMHNKAFIADNSVAIVGGRNIADEYFGARDDVNFGDMDIMTVGPVTRKISGVFDDYWNSVLAIPIQALEKRRPTSAELKANRDFLAANREYVHKSGFAMRLLNPDFLKRMEAGSIPFVWAPAEVIFDDPLKVIRPEDFSHTVMMGPEIRSLLEKARREALVITPYFVPTKAGVRWFKKLMGRGLTVKVLTNSLASTDSALAQGGYARYRKPLLQTGVELYELKPNPDQKRFWDTISLGGSSRGALHAKTLIVDGQVVFVGSFNLDPRSARLDTQNGIVIRSGELAAQARRLFARGVSPSNAYRVQLAAASPDAAGGRGLIWVTEENGREVRYFHDPRTGMWRRLGVKVLSWLAPESML